MAVSQDAATRTGPDGGDGPESARDAFTEIAAAAQMCWL